MDMFQLRQEIMATFQREGKPCNHALAGMVAHDEMRERHRQHQLRKEANNFHEDVSL